MLDLSGEIQQIGFTRANEVNVFIKVNAKTNTSFTSNGVELLKTALVKYIGGTDYDNNTYAGLNMGEDVVISRLIARAYSVDGIDDVMIEVSKGGVIYNTSNIIIALQEVAQTHFNDIEVILNV